MKQLDIDKSWTLFLDRDGVINKLIPWEYIETWDQFEFLPGVLDALPKLAARFGKIIIITNQQGIAKKIMTEEALLDIHAKMMGEITQAGGRIDAIYHCPHLEESGCPCRKPKPGMPMDAQRDFPDIDFSKSVFVGDSDLDVELGKSLSMYTVLTPSVLDQNSEPDLRVEGLGELSLY